MPRKKKAKKFVAVTSLFNLKVQDVLKYVQKLHQHIDKQNKRINKLKLKIKKIVMNKSNQFSENFHEIRLNFRHFYQNWISTLPKQHRKQRNKWTNTREMENLLSHHRQRKPRQLMMIKKNRKMFSTLSMKSKLKQKRLHGVKPDSSTSQLPVFTMTPSPPTITRLITIFITTERMAIGTDWIPAQMSSFSIAELKQVKLLKR